MEMKFYEADYIGLATVDQRLSAPMIPWIMAQIRRGPNVQKVRLCVEKGCVTGYRKSADKRPLFAHPLHLVAKHFMNPGDLTSFLYIVRDTVQPLLYIHLFQSTDIDEVMELFATMRDQTNKSVNNSNAFFGGTAGGGSGTQRSLSSGSSLTTLCPDISPSSSHFFEVLYIGKIKVTHKRVPDTFIDDALDKFHKLEKEKREKEITTKEENGGLNFIGSKEKSECFGSTETLKSDSSKENVPKILMRKRSGSAGSVLIKKPENLNVANASIQEHNRTMVFHVGRTDIRLISPDRKQVLLHKHLKEITYSVQGTKHASHFAFICRESSDPPSFIGYVFKCQSNSVAEDVVTAISQALSSETSRRADAVVSCDHCPMVWYHRLCSEIEGLSEKASHVAILRKLELLPEDEQTIVQTKLQGALETGGNPKEQIELFMMILRTHCEGKQSRHVHDTPENRHEFLNHYLGGGTIFMKAKRSLTNSFDQLLKRKGSRDDFSPILKELSLPANALLCSDSSNSEGCDSTKESGFGQNTSIEEKAGPMMNIFLKVGNSPTKSSSDEGEKDESTINHTGSWRQAIFNTVVTPSKIIPEPKQEKRDKNFYKALWKKAINQQVLLIRMEKENARLTARQEEANVKRVKLEYDDLSIKENTEIWDSIVSKDLFKSDQKLITKSLRQGIPKGKRGEVWMYLAEKYSSQTACEAKTLPNYNVSYEILLKQLTSHQHAILIDLGRTFPSHIYYSSPLGPGQLALFNLLKAYSLIDPEVGYCQGLSFIAGILLLHVSEELAFVLLKHLMFVRGLRSRFLPDMAALQVNLYQLSRLLHDHHPDLYAHFDKYEVSPTLYAAPWLLTIFASQFPLGFVTRIFDVIFADSTDVLFRAAMTLLGYHKNNLLECESFEIIMDYLKNKIPNIDKPTLDKIMTEVLSINISKELNEYGVEYHVLQEEMSTPHPEIKKLKQLEATNKSLSDQNRALTQQLQIATSNINRLESSRSTFISQLNRLESQIRSLEVTVSTLGEFITELAYNKETSNIEIPSEILRIVTQLNVSEQRKRSFKNESNVINLRKKQDQQLRTLSSSSLLSKQQENNKRQPTPPLKLALSSPNLTSKMTNLLVSTGLSKNQKLTTLIDTNNDDSTIPLKKSLSDTNDIRVGGEARELIIKSKSTEKMLQTLDPPSNVGDFGRVLNDADMKALGLIKDDSRNDEVTHPLMDSEGEVRVSFEGTSKLKSIRPNRINKLETDQVGLKIVEGKDLLSNRVKTTMTRVHSLFDSQETVLFDQGNFAKIKDASAIPLNKLETDSGPIIGSQVTQKKTGLLT